MATKVAELAVDITTNFAKVHEDLRGLSNSVESAAASMSKAFSTAGNFLVGLAAGFLSVGAAAKVLHAGLDFGDQLQTNNEKLGISVQKLQELSAIAVQNNTSIDALGKSFKFLGDAMIKAQNSGSEQAKLFRALGVEIKNADGSFRSVTAVQADLADGLGKVSDEVVRTGAGVKLMGKSYLEVAPALRTFRDSQDEANKIIEIFGTVSNDSAKAADAFGDRLKLLGEGVKAATLTGMTSGLKALNEALIYIEPAVAAVTKVFAAFIGFLIEKAATVIINVVNLLEKLAATFVATAKFLAQPISFNIDTSAFTKLRAEIDSLDKARQQALAKAGAAAHPEQQSFDAASFRKFEEGQRRAEDASKKVAAALAGVDKEAAKLQRAFESAFQSIGKTLLTAQENLEDFDKAITEKTSPSMKALLVIMGSPDWEKFSESQRQRIIDQGLEADAIDHTTAALRQAKENAKLYYDNLNLQNKAIDQAADAGDEFLRGLVQQDEEYRFQIGLMGQTAVVQEKLIALRKIDLALEQTLAKLDPGSAQYENDLKRLNAAAALAKQQVLFNIDVQESQQRFLSGWGEVLRSTTDRFADFFVDLAEHGSSAFKNLWEDFKHWALEAIAKIAAQQIVLSIIGNASPLSGIASGLSGGPLGNILGGSGGGLFSIAKSLFSPLESLFSGGGILGTIGTSFANLNVALTGGIGAIGGFGAGLTSLLPALGAIGGAIGLAVAAFSAFSKGGGPKEGGFATVGVERGSYFPGESTAAGDEAVRKLVESVGKSFDEALQKLGGKALDIGFALGYDTDPQGKAQSNVHGGVFKGGQSIFENPNPNVGRSPEELTAELQHQAQQMLLIALQSSDLPKYVAALLNSVNAASASSDEIAAILATAQAIKSVADAFPALQLQIENLDPEQIKAFIDALGGADQLAATFGYLQKNFTTTTDAVKDATDKLTADFTALGLAVPATHQGFLDLLSSFDLTTDAGRELYAAVAALAPEFVAVAGSADEAAKKLQDATSFFKQNFYSDAEKNAEAIASATRDLDAAQAALGITIPRTAEAFRALVEGIDRTTPAGEALYAALVAVAPAILAVSGGLKAMTAAAAAAIPVISSISTVFGDITPSGTPKIKKWVERLRDLSREVSDDMGEQLSFMVDQIGKEIVDVKKQMQDALDVGDLWTAGALRELITSLENSNTAITNELAHYITLSAQYDSTKAEQLVNLEKWYADQQKIYKGDTVLLEALAKIFAKKWDDIIKGVSDGVDGTIGELDRLRKGIADYLKSLQLSELSPLTPAQKLAEAQAQYQDALAKAAAGDPQALADITKFADNYLKQAREFYASSPIYADIFKQITEALAALAGTTTTGAPFPKQGPGPQPGPHGELAITNDPLLAALPSVGNKLASAEDIQKATDSLGRMIADALAAVADANTQDSATVVSELQSTAVKIVDGLGGNLK